MRVLGLGEPGAGPSLPDHAAGFLRSELGVSGAVVSAPVSLEEVRLRPPALGRVRAGWRRSRELRDDPAARVGRCRGKSYLDLLRQRAGDCEDAPDAVVAPASAEAVAGRARRVRRGGRGGGAVRRRHERGRRARAAAREPRRAGSLDLGRLEGIESFDERSQLAWLGGGTRLPEADHALGQRGYMLGHTPQSYEWATVGGCVATRSAGQSSTGHGRIEENVVALRCATPAGELANLPVPATAAGPALKQLVMGSEGILGAITSVGLRVFPLPAARRYEGFAFRDFEAGWEALRAARAGRDGAGHRAALRRGGDADVVRAGRQRGQGARDGRGAARALRAGVRVGGRARSRVALRRELARRRCAARAVGRSARRRARRGPPRATPGRTCATTCSTAA